MSSKQPIKGRGAQLNVPNRFLDLNHARCNDDKITVWSPEIIHQKDTLDKQAKFNFIVQGFYECYKKFCSCIVTNSKDS